MAFLWVFVRARFHTSGFWHDPKIGTKDRLLTSSSIQPSSICFTSTSHSLISFLKLKRTTPATPINKQNKEQHNICRKHNLFSLFNSELTTSNNAEVPSHQIFQAVWAFQQFDCPVGSGFLLHFYNCNRSLVESLERSFPHTVARKYEW